MYAILKYKTVDDYIIKRQAFRAAHFELVQTLYQKGQLILGGALENPSNEALIIFKAPDAIRIATSFVENDPYVQNSLVLEWEIRPWQVAIGA